VLTHAETRSAYDAMLTAAGSDPPSPKEAGESAPVRERNKPAGVAALSAPRAIDELALEEEEPGEYDGGRLRRSRIHRGIELEDIAGWTKINPTYLRFIEEDRYDELPAPVYVRGFVTAYAECVGLDGKQVASSYMQSFEGGTRKDRRGRFLAGR